MAPIKFAWPADGPATSSPSSLTAGDASVAASAPLRVLLGSAYDLCTTSHLQFQWRAVGNGRPLPLRAAGDGAPGARAAVPGRPHTHLLGGELPLPWRDADEAPAAAPGLLQVLAAPAGAVGAARVEAWPVGAAGAAGRGAEHAEREEEGGGGWRVLEVQPALEPRTAREVPLPASLRDVWQAAALAQVRAQSGSPAAVGCLAGRFHLATRVKEACVRSRLLPSLCAVCVRAVIWAQASDVWVEVHAVLAHDAAWAPAGHVVAAQQLPLPLPAAPERQEPPVVPALVTELLGPLLQAGGDGPAGDVLGGGVPDGAPPLVVSQVCGSCGDGAGPLVLLLLRQGGA